ncbi:Protein-arginine deiminase [Purpureocillium lavendulum]|uniref:Protein-arginine deiminase n=1 Tax=Purpureocillium lavendulum TaxID=1247861 RepID=A0AB34FEM1_9HYPO|nr:Protein-arginine deiminase [Purpureocillium lavendulum]
MEQCSHQAAGIARDERTVEVDEDDVDSSYGDEISSASTSLRTSIFRYEWKHGRRYHSYQAGSYSFPNDDQEQDRLDMIHHLYCRALDDRLFLAPIDPTGLHILDIGTGTGIWPIDLADQFPIQFSQPPNVTFVVDDVELDWVEPRMYDFIHCQYMAGAIKDWPRLVHQIFNNLKPGGWVEFQECVNTPYSEDDSLKPGNPLVQMVDGIRVALDKIGRTGNPAPSFKRWAQDAGFTRLEEQRFRMPVGSWPKDPRLKEIGAFLSVNISEGVEGFTASLFRDVLGWSREELEVHNARVRSALRAKGVHAIFDLLVVTGMKPR